MHLTTSEPTPVPATSRADLGLGTSTMADHLQAPQADPEPDLEPDTVDSEPDLEPYFCLLRSNHVPRGCIRKPDRGLLLLRSVENLASVDFGIE